MSVAAITGPAAIYREEQLFGWWVYALLAAMMTFGGLGFAWTRPLDPALPRHAWSLDLPLGVLVGVTLPSVLVVGVLRMTTEVRPGEVLVWFGWIPSYRRAVALAGVQRVEVVRYRPLTDCGGWGVRRGRDGERVLNARGNQGVRLHFADGSCLLIGSQRPEPLATAIQSAMGSSC
ncbi:MAG: hypothetical protein ABI353_03735 [Isosphaeraceae bacterium]